MGKIDFLRRAQQQNPLVHPRQLIEDEIERLIGLLDAADGDSDHEDVDEDFEPDADEEPSLGWCGKELLSGRYEALRSSNLEAEHDGREPDADRERDADFEPDMDGEPWLAGFGGWGDAGDDRELDEAAA